MRWLYMGISILFEVLGTTVLKHAAISDNNVRLLYGLSILCYFVCFYFLGYTLKYFELGSIYAIWSGVGIALLTGVGIILFGDSVSIQKVVFIILIIVGTIGLNLSGIH